MNKIYGLVSQIFYEGLVPHIKNLTISKMAENSFFKDSLNNRGSYWSTEQKQHFNTICIALRKLFNNNTEEANLKSLVSWSINNINEFSVNSIIDRIKYPFLDIKERQKNTHIFDLSDFNKLKKYRSQGEKIYLKIFKPWANNYAAHLNSDKNLQTVLPPFEVGKVTDLLEISYDIIMNIFDAYYNGRSFLDSNDKIKHHLLPTISDIIDDLIFIIMNTTIIPNKKTNNIRFFKEKSYDKIKEEIKEEIKIKYLSYENSLPYDKMEYEIKINLIFDLLPEIKPMRV